MAFNIENILKSKVPEESNEPKLDDSSNLQDQQIQQPPPPFMIPPILSAAANWQEFQMLMGMGGMQLPYAW